MHHSGEQTLSVALLLAGRRVANAALLRWRVRGQIHHGRRGGPKRSCERGQPTRHTLLLLLLLQQVLLQQVLLLLLLPLILSMLPLLLCCRCC